MTTGDAPAGATPLDCRVGSVWKRKGEPETGAVFFAVVAQMERLDGSLMYMLDALGKPLIRRLCVSQEELTELYSPAREKPVKRFGYGCREY